MSLHRYQNVRQIMESESEGIGAGPMATPIPAPADSQSFPHQSMWSMNRDSSRHDIHQVDGAVAFLSHLTGWRPD